MTALVEGNARTVLLVLPHKKEMYPLSTDAFTRAQASRRKLATEYKDALVFDGDGSVKKIEHVEVIGPWGDSLGRKLLSRLTDAWRIDVRFSEPLSYPLEEIKRVLIDCSASPGFADTMDFDDAELERFVASIRAAPSFAQLIELLKLPTPEDALDVL